MEVEIVILYILVVLSLCMATFTIVYEHAFSTTAKVPIPQEESREAGAILIATESGEEWTNTLPPITATVNANASQVTNMAEPLLDNDGATKSYVDKQSGSVPGGPANAVQFSQDTFFTGVESFTYNDGLLTVPSLTTKLTFAPQPNVSGLGTQAQALDMGNHDVNNVDELRATNIYGTIRDPVQTNITQIGPLSADLDCNNHNLLNIGTFSGQLATGA